MRRPTSSSQESNFMKSEQVSHDSEGVRPPSSATMKRTLAVLLLLAATASAEEKKLLVSSAFADPSLVAPVVRLDVDRGDGTSYAVGLSGWTIDGEWNRQLTQSRALRFTADAT